MARVYMSDDDFEIHVEESPPLVITVVPDLPCPGCGAYWGHPDPALDFPNRPKVGAAFKCYNPACKVDYYNVED